MTTVSLKLPKELAARLNAEARKRGVSRSAFIRNVLGAFLTKPHVGGCVADLAGDLVGSVEGPRDLSSNPKHLDGFGE